MTGDNGGVLVARGDQKCDGVGSNDRDATQILCGHSGAIAYGCSDAGERGYRGKRPASKHAFARVLEHER